MKKTFRFLSMAAHLVVGAIMIGCSSDDKIDNPQLPANKDNVVTLTATVGFEANATTRSVDPSTGMKTFETGNQIAVIYKNTSNETVKAVSTDFTPTGDNTKATFTVSLTSPASNSAIRYIYPATMAKGVATGATITDDAATIDYSGLFSSQDGSLATLGTNYDLAVFDGSLSGTDLPASAILTNPLAICKFALTDGTNPVSVTSLTINDGTNAYIVTPTAALSDIYVAMKPVASGNFCFTANNDTKYYTKVASGKTLAASKLYPITLPMTEFSLATPMTLEAITAGTIIIKNPKTGMQYSKNGGDMTDVNATAIEVAAGDKVAFYCNTTESYYSTTTKIGVGTAELKVYGNIMSLVNGTDFASATVLSSSYTFDNLFNSITMLKDACGLLLPATTLNVFCYASMFMDCTCLVTAPKELPATNLSASCYYHMFYRCTSLATTPELKAESLSNRCCYGMFQECSSLTTAPELKAESLSYYCYVLMFEGCSSLTAAYVMAAYDSESCNKMFENCTAIGAKLHTTTENKGSWSSAISSKGWSTWEAVGDWN